MRKFVKSAAFPALTLIVGLIIGSVVTAKTAKREDTKIIHALVLSHASLTTVHYTKLLTAIREGKQDLAVDRMEMLLSSAVREIGQEYSETRDYYGSAARALALANEYRTSHPRVESLDSLTQETQAALATKTAPVQPYPGEE